MFIEYKTAGCKKQVRDLLRKRYNVCDPEDIQSISMGCQGTDVVLSQFAKSIIKFDIECKCQENISIWKCLEQTEANTGEGRIGLLCFKRNRSKSYAVIELETLMRLI